MQQRSNMFLIKLPASRVLLLCCLMLTSISAWLADQGPDYQHMLILAQQRYDAQGLQSVTDWQSLIRSPEQPTENTLQRVNRFINQRIQFNSDLAIWNNKDYWATPLQTLGRGQGDCEDFSIAKYFSLLLMGITPEQLRLVYVKASIGGPNSRVSQAHMVVAYYPKPDSEPLILDNLIDDILPAGQRPDLKPVYSFNSVGLWVGGASHASITQPEQRLSRWRDVLVRMQEEGLR